MNFYKVFSIEKNQNLLWLFSIITVKGWRIKERSLFQNIDYDILKVCYRLDGF